MKKIEKIIPKQENAKNMRKKQKNRMTRSAFRRQKRSTLATVFLEIPEDRAFFDAIIVFSPKAFLFFGRIFDGFRKENGVKYSQDRAI